MLDRCPYISVCDNMHIVVSLGSHPFCVSSACVCNVQLSDGYSGSDVWLGICELMGLAHQNPCLVHSGFRQMWGPSSLCFSLEFISCCFYLSGLV